MLDMRFDPITSETLSGFAGFVFSGFVNGSVHGESRWPKAAPTFRRNGCNVSSFPRLVNGECIHRGMKCILWEKFLYRFTPKHNQKITPKIRHKKKDERSFFRFAICVCFCLFPPLLPFPFSIGCFNLSSRAGAAKWMPCGYSQLRIKVMD